MADMSPEMKVYLAEYQRRYAPLIAEYEAIIRHALRNDLEFDPTSPAIVRGIQPQSNGGTRLVPGASIPTGRATPKVEGAWMPDRQVLAEVLARTLENRSRRWLPDERRYLPMPEEWTEVLRRRWPGQFDCELSIGVGWVDLLIAAHTCVAELGGDFRWSQIKEKFGGIRLYFDGDVGNAGREIVMIAEYVLRFCICETCGAPGRKRNSGGWLSTQCDAHAPGGAR